MHKGLSLCFDIDMRFSTNVNESHQSSLRDHVITTCKPSASVNFSKTLADEKQLGRFLNSAWRKKT